MVECAIERSDTGVVGLIPPIRLIRGIKILWSTGWANTMVYDYA